MPRYWVDKVQDALNDDGKPVKGSRVLVLGVAYKKDVDDVRESPALDIIELLRPEGRATCATTIRTCAACSTTAWDLELRAGSRRRRRRRRLRADRHRPLCV